MSVLDWLEAEGFELSCLTLTMTRRVQVTCLSAVRHCRAAAVCMPRLSAPRHRQSVASYAGIACCCGEVDG